MIGRLRPQGPAVDETPRGFDAYDLRLGDVMRGERATLGKSLLDIQRDLKIKATYIAAIENADPSAFETKGFIAGYVRSYARYLDLDPDWAFRAFCAESGFTTVSAMSRSGSASREPERRARGTFGETSIAFAPRRAPRPFAPFQGMEAGAIGSVAVLLCLIGVLGYGAFAVLKEVQRVRVVPVDQAPQVVADIDPLVTPAPETGGVAAGGELTAATDRFDRLYRPQALDVPVLVPRDGPIATLDTRRQGAPAAPAGAPVLPAEAAGIDLALQEALGIEMAATDLLRPAEGPEATEGPRVSGGTAPRVALVASEETWVRVRSAEGTTIFERVMQPGDTYVLPATEAPATLRSGNSGGVYFALDGTPYGPAGARGQVIGDVELTADALAGRYEIADIAADQTLARSVAELTGAAAPDPSGE